MTADGRRPPLETVKHWIRSFRRWSRPLRGKPRWRPPVERAPTPHFFIALPLGFATEATAPRGGLGVLVHAYHVDVLPRLVRSLAAIPIAHTLIVTTDTPAKAEAIGAALAASPYATAQIVVAPNRGRDVAPRLVALREVYQRFDLVLHLHTKKSPHDSGLRDWLPELLDDLLGDPAIVASVLELFARQPTLGVVAPRYFHRIRDNRDWGQNYAHCQALAARLGADVAEDDLIDFPAGSMFWARTAALRPLINLALTLDDFEEEKGQVDGTLAHAIERLVFFSCEAAGFDWCFAGKAPPRRAYERAVAVAAPQDIAAAIAATSRRLSRRSAAPRPQTPEPPAATSR